MQNQKFNWFMYLIFLLGQVLPKENIEGIIKFAKEEGLFILSDEVCILK